MPKTEQSDNSQFIPIPMACLTISDTRDEASDVSGGVLAQGISDAGHNLVDRCLVKDDIYEIRAVVSRWIAMPDISVIITTGGTGMLPRDNTPEALSVLFDKTIDGFGELFRHLSYDQIGTSTIQSRVCAGFANNTFIFVLPGSHKACHTGWDIISQQFDRRQHRCSFVNVLHNQTLFPPR